MGEVDLDQFDVPLPNYRLPTNSSDKNPHRLPTIHQTPRNPNYQDLAPHLNQRLARQGTADPELVRVAAEGERLAFGYLFNPAFAVETALIGPLPHQWITVSRHLLPQARLRFLLADDAGAGKTIMVGIDLQEMLVRRLIRRILVVPPAGLD